MRTLQSIIPTSEQLRVLTDDAPGFRLIRGAAGSGKTTAALMRLRQLCASRLNRRNRLGLEEPIRVLVLTFNRTLRGYITQLVNEQVPNSDNLDITVETFAKWALDTVGQRHIFDGDKRDSTLKKLLVNSGVPQANLEYFIDEIGYVLGRFPSDRRQEYIRATRTGRGRSPAVPQQLRRKLLSDVIEPYEEEKSRHGILDWNDLAIETAAAKSVGYDVVVIDESQDLSANQIRAILAHLNADHVTTFIIDAVQRIYPQGFQWRELDITMRPEMVFTLERNHRNTAEIARFAASLVQDLPQEDDGVLPDDGACEENGNHPQVVEGRFSDQINYMLTQIQPCLEAGETVAILHPRGGGWFNFTRRKLRERGIEFCELTRSSEWPTGPEQLALSTIHSAKGLEFDHVLLPGLTQEVTPHGGEDGDGTLDTLLRLVGMGIGRARKTVILGYKHGEQSTVIDLFDPTTYDLVKV